MTRSRCLLLIAAASCARGGSGVDPDPDAAVSIDAGPDACVVKTFYRDMDGDGHGDVAKPVQGCDPPAGTVASSGDCDDNNPQRHPGHPELCDALDNDCNAATADTMMCPTGCTPTRRPAPLDARAYLVCNVSTTWTNASAICNGAMYKLVQIDDVAENLYVRSAGDAGFGTGAEFHIGANDIAAEGAWVWESGVQFWQGTNIGMAVNNKYSNWDPSEPNNSGNAEDCAHMKIDALWNDVSCNSLLKFICRR